MIGVNLPNGHETAVPIYNPIQNPILFIHSSVPKPPGTTPHASISTMTDQNKPRPKVSLSLHPRTQPPTSGAV